jgi:flagellar motor switch protein FliG
MTTALTGQEKAAVLLSTLEPETAQSILSRLGPERGALLRATMQQLAQAPQAQETQRAVLDEFAEMLERGIRDAAPKLKIAATSDTGENGNEPINAPVENNNRPSRTVAGPVQPQIHQEPMEDEDSLEALRHLPAADLALALDGEQPRTTAMVLNYIDTYVAGDVLKLLPLDTRREVSVQMGQGASGNRELIMRIAEALLRKKRGMSDKAYTLSSDAKAHKLAEMLRLLDRAERVDILAALEQRDPVSAGQVKDCLYTFDDLRIIVDRSVQKILAEIDSKTLAVALKDAPQEIVDKIMNNLSKRARESLTDEIGFLGPVASSQVQQAQKVIVDVIQRLDLAGDLVMVE